ncbi:helix-turn-helix transcriptional regulator [Desulfonauticus submarinus]
MNEDQKDNKKKKIEVTIDGMRKYNIEADNIVMIMPNKKVKMTRWFMMFQDFIIELSKDKDIKGEDFRVLLYLLANMDFENWIQVTQETISKELQMKKTNISRALKKLKDKNIIEVAKRGRINIYRLNPDIVWKGSYKELQNYYKKVLDFSTSKEKEVENKEN